MTQVNEWRVDGPDVDGAYWITGPVVEVDGEKVHSPIADEIYDETTARMMAAAPKMLALLKQCLTRIEIEDRRILHSINQNSEIPFVFSSEGSSPEVKAIRALIQSLEPAQ